ncbi:MAG: acyl-CoA dehydrogenase family protein [SAR324 cluster bacterium]|nr:acyl-CoA dehydrogenase family protein [SAR324 cluster bacterium]
MEDFLLTKELFTAEERDFQEKVGHFVDEYVIPRISDAWENAKFLEDLIPQIAELGCLGSTLPKEYGCGGEGYVTYGIICQELERGDSSMRSFASVQSSLCMYPIYKFGSEDQKKKLLPGMARGEIIGCFGLTEPDSGSDPSSMRTHVRKVPGGWILNGSKMWITNGPFADIAIVWAKTEEGIRGFIVEKEVKGFQRIEMKNKMSLRSSSTGELIFEDCFLPEENILPNSRGLSSALSCLTQARYGIAWGMVGAAIACYENALQYVHQSKHGEKSLAASQLVQTDLADMLTEIVKTQAFNLQLGRLKEKGKDSFVMASMAKMNACREALDIARKARDLIEYSGTMIDAPAARHMMNIESVFTLEGTDNIHHLTLGRHITGVNAFT